MRRPWLLFFVAGLVAPIMGAADTLVTRDGATIEIDGKYTVRGRNVVFTLPNGTLSSLPTAELDLDATAAANAPPPPPAAPPPPPPPRPSVLVLTDRDVARAQVEPLADVPAATAPGVADEASDATASTEVASALPSDESVLVPLSGMEVVRWSVQDSGLVDGLEIHGEIRNDGRDIAVELAVSVTLDGPEGLVLYEGFVASPVLAPGRRAAFRIPLPGRSSAPEEADISVSGRGTRPRVLGSADSEDADSEDVDSENGDTPGEG